MGKKISYLEFIERLEMKMAFTNDLKEREKLENIHKKTMEWLMVDIENKKKEAINGTSKA